MTDVTLRPCAACGKMLKGYEQYGPDYLHPLCREHWNAEQHHGQMPLPEPTQTQADAFGLFAVAENAAGEGE